MKIYTFYPSWNLTALVDYKPKDNEDKDIIEQEIFSQNPNIEQVWFIYQEDSVYKLEMAHNELCVNAIFSYLCYLDIHEHIVHVEIYLVWPDYGILGKKTHIQWEYILEFPAIREYQIVKIDNATLVELPGITHIFFEGSGECFDSFLEKTIPKLDKTINRVTWINTVWANSQLIPYIYYQRTGKIVHETSCSSGSIALVARDIFSTRMAWSWISKVLQVSGDVLEIETNFSDKTLHCCIKNRVKKEKDLEIS